MPRCAYCGRDLPGFETTCQECFEARSESVVHPEPWWHRLRPRMTRENLLGFGVLFVFSFAMLRFDFPWFHPVHQRATDTSLAISTVFACIAFFHQGKNKPKTKVEQTLNGGANVKVRPDWSRLAAMAGIELIAGAILFAAFTYLPKAAVGCVVLLGIIITQIDIVDPIRTKSLGTLLRWITGIPTALCFLMWRITDAATWENLALTCFMLFAGLLFLDRREASK
jgi:hypothetical protein